MKKLMISLALVMLFSGLFAQAPQGITHQAVFRNTQGELLTNQLIGIQVSILQGSAEGTAVYVETHSPTSNAHGLITYVIGKGTNVSGSFENIAWAAGPYFLKTEVDPAGGINYTITGTTQFLSVPYALHAKTAESLSEEIVETDPVFMDSPAAGILLEDLDSWDEAFFWGNHNGLYRPDDWTPDWSEMPFGDNSGEMRYWDGNTWVAIEPGQYGQTLSWCNGIPIWGDCPPSVPVVTTGAVTNITENSANGSGTVVNQGSAFVITRGLVWGTDPNPTLQNNDGSASSGSNIGSFTLNLSGLTAHTEYYVRAYATNAEGSAYGNQVSFTTEATTVFPPELTTAEVTGITKTNATSGGNISDDGGAEVMARGIVWHTTSNPTLENNLGQTNDGSGTGSYVSEITELEPNTGYYLRAYAVNSQGVSYGNQRVFSTLLDADLPTVITAEATEVNQTSATTGGEVTDDGGSTVLARGVCWSTQESPTLYDHYVVEGSGLGVFTSHISGLLQNTTYYARAFATSSQGVGYGNQVSFTTDAGLAMVAIVSLNTGQPGLRVFDAEVTCDGGAEVTARGFVWDTAEDPTLDQSEGHTDEGGGLGAYTSYLTNLTPNTKYYIRAYATNSVGRSYSDQKIFNFWDYHGTVTDIDNNVYQTVMVGEQEWMSENLRVSRYRNAIPIPTGLSDEDWRNTKAGAYAVHSNNIDMVEAYGKLYNWYAVADPKGLCPVGWHVPGDDEWKQLELYICNALGNAHCETQFISVGWNGTNEGNALKSCRQMNSPWDGCNTSEHPFWFPDDIHNGFDEFGFSAFPGGVRWESGVFYSFNSGAYWWSATESSETFAWRRRLYRDHGGIWYSNALKQKGYSIRCVKDAE